ncbi:MAG: hypothetical protein J1E28_00205 [Helicobacter sp.]|uniref:hypothetical protein n=1 Tax=Helicobacter sp. TaxID=218 RepID=UPI0025C49F42|nr:hypothetical protein [Helicobacter sp.]MCH5312810.1 hypothetical protein [Helicobacter sp.]
MKLCKKICIIYGLLALSFQFVIAATATEELFFTQLQAIKAQMPKAAEKYIEEIKRLEKANSDAALVDMIASRQERNPVEAYKIDRGEVLLRKYSGKIGEREVSFFVQIYKKNITHGVIALPNEPMIPFKITKNKKAKIGFNFPYSSTMDMDIDIDLNLNQNLELQVGIKKQKLATFAPQCPATKVCSYVRDYVEGSYSRYNDFLYFPDLQIMILSSDDGFTATKAQSLQEAREKKEIDEYSQYRDSPVLLFINDTYISFSNLYGSGSMGESISEGVLFDIKTKKLLNTGGVDKLPKSLARKYITGENDSIRDFEYSGLFYYYSYYRDGICPATFDEETGERIAVDCSVDNRAVIPIEELKPYLKAGVYDYLIGKSPTPPKALLQTPKVRDF